MKVKTAYNNQKAKNYNKSRFDSIQGKFTHKLEFFLLQNMLFKVIKKNHKVLEIGCGTGRFIKEFCNCGFRVDGLDASRDMIAIAKTFCKKNKFYHGSVCNLKNIQFKYDIIYSVRLLHILQNIESSVLAIKQMMQALRKNGYLLIEFANDERPFPIFNKSPRFSFRQIAAIAKEKNFQIIAKRSLFISSFSFFYKTPRIVVPLLYFVEKTFALFFHSFGSRGYVLLKKN